MPEALSAIDAHLGLAEAGLAPEDLRDFARRDLQHAVAVALARDGALLTAGEALVARRFLALPEPAMSLYARLFGRRPRVFWLAGLSYAEIPDPAEAAAELVARELAWDALRLAPARWLAEASTVPELVAAAAALGRSTRGPRAALLERLGDPEARPALARPGLVLRHRGLFRRLARLYLHDHEGDLSRFVVARLGLLRPPDYAPTGGEGLFPRRQDLLDYEAALARAAASEGWSGEDLIREGEAALADLERRAPAPDWRRRFSARRWDEGVALAAARHLERLGETARAEAMYARLLAAGTRHPEEAALRRALCLEGLGRVEEGARLCAEARQEVDGVGALALERTGRRLARRAKLPWAPLPAPRPAPERRVLLPRAAVEGRRPGWRGGGVDGVIEAALAAALGERGRVALHGENDLWTTLFGLLFREALFAPVPGMLPTPLLAAPLDLGTPGFYTRRAALLEQILAALGAGEGPGRLEAELARSAGLAIRGVRWDLFSPETLLGLAGALPGPALAATMRFFAEDWAGAVGGLPDLCLLPGPAVPLPGAEPAALPEGLLFVEVKGPTDALRDAQRIWHDRLLSAGVPVEIWWVEAAPPAGGAEADR